MKSDPAALLLGIGIAVLVGGIIVSERKAPAAPAPGPNVPQIDPTIGSWNLVNRDALAAAYADSAKGLMQKNVPLHSFVTTNNMQPDLDAGVNVGTVSTWIAQENAAGHKVFMKGPILDPTNPQEIAYVFVLDAPLGTDYTEVTS